MNRSKLTKFKQLAHDQSIDLKGQYKGGRTLASTQLIGDTLLLVEKILEAILEDDAKQNTS